MRNLTIDEIINLQLRSIKWRPKRCNPIPGEWDWAAKTDFSTIDNPTVTHTCLKFQPSWLKRLRDYEYIAVQGRGLLTIVIHPDYVIPPELRDERPLS